MASAGDDVLVESSPDADQAAAPAIPKPVASPDLRGAAQSAAMSALAAPRRRRPRAPPPVPNSVQGGPSTPPLGPRGERSRAGPDGHHVES